MNTNEPEPLPVEPESIRDLLRATLPHLRWLAAGSVHGTADLCWTLDAIEQRWAGRVNVLDRVAVAETITRVLVG